MKLANRLFWTVVWFVLFLYLVNGLALLRMFYRLLSVERILGNAVEPNRKITEYFDDSNDEERTMRKRLR